MYKTDVIKRVAKDTRLSQKIVADVVHALHEVVETALHNGQEVQFSGFGTFYTRKRSEGRIKSFRTKQVVKVPAMRIAGFRAGELLKRAVRKSGKAGKKRTIFGSVLRRSAE